MTPPRVFDLTDDPSAPALKALTEALQAWMDMHRRSPLDGTASCRTCGALVLDGDQRQRHNRWHCERGE